MDYKVIPFEQRIKENIRSYSLENLYALDVLTEYCKAFCAVADVAILITERHGFCRHAFPLGRGDLSTYGDSDLCG